MTRGVTMIKYMSTIDAPVANFGMKEQNTATTYGQKNVYNLHVQISLLIIIFD